MRRNPFRRTCSTALRTTSNDTRSLAEFLADRQPLQLDEVSEIAGAQAARRLVADEADEMGRALIVAVEFLRVRAGLLGQKHRGSNGVDHQQVIGPASDPDLHAVN